MGKVKTKQVKGVGKELMERYPDKFSDNFEENKHTVEALTQGTTTRIRNQIAGYITRTMASANSESSDENLGEEDLEE